MRRTQWSEEWGKRRTPNVGRGKSPFPKGRIIRMSKTQGKCQSANLADVGALPWLILMRLPWGEQVAKGMQVGFTKESQADEIAKGLLCLS